MTQLKMGVLWDEYSIGGRTVADIAKCVGVSFGTMRAFLALHPEYFEVARKRQREAAARARAEARKPIDDGCALAMLRSGHSTRAVAASFGVSTRTLRKRLQPYPEYRDMMRERTQKPEP